MLSEGAENEGGWLVDACTAEIRVHRLIFLFVLGPLLAYVLPALMFTLGMAFVLTTSASFWGHELADDSIWNTIPWIVGFVLPVPTLAVGAVREWRRLVTSDRSAQSTGMRLPSIQGDQLRGVVSRIWHALASAAQVEPKLICQPNFRVAAHAYDNDGGRAIEVSAGLAARLVRDDPLALSILRHEMAHLVHRDLPAIRWQSLVAGAATFSADGAMLICLIAAALIVSYTDLGAFPLKPTIVNVVAVHAAILCATLIVVLPLFLGRYLVRRYSAFLVALAEMRADVSAGIWGDGLKSFSARLEADPTVRSSTLRDRGLAYISTTLSHFPASERIAMLASAERLATPKLRYFAIAILFIWLLAFHQGSEGWDTLLLAASVALLQGMTVGLLLNMAGNAKLSWRRAIMLAIGAVLTQALPLISIESLAYLAEDLTAALVTPGGFGSADARPLQDTIDTFAEFGRLTETAVGAWGLPLALLLVLLCYGGLSRLREARYIRRRVPSLVAVSLIAALTSLAVSYRFFQTAMYETVRQLAFRLGNTDAQSDSLFSGLPDAWRQGWSTAAFALSDVLNGPPWFDDAAWLRVILPSLTAFLTALLIIALPATVDSWRSRFSQARPTR